MFGRSAWVGSAVPPSGMRRSARLSVVVVLALGALVGSALLGDNDSRRQHPGTARPEPMATGAGGSGLKGDDAASQSEVALAKAGLSLGPPDSGRQTPSVRGTVVSSAHVAIAGAQVVLRDGHGEAQESATDELGRFQFAVPVGVYRLAIEKPGYVGWSSGEFAVGDQGFEFPSAVLTQPGTIRVTVPHSGSGLIVDCVLFRAGSRTDAGLVTRLSAPSNEPVVFQGVVPGNFDVVATSGELIGEAAVTVSSGKESSVSLGLERSARIRVTIRCPDQCLNPRAEFLSGDPGRYSELPVEEVAVVVAPGVHRIRGRDNFRISPWAVMSIKPGETRDHVIRLQTAPNTVWVVTGRVRWPDGSPAANASVDIRSNDYVSATETTDETGAFVSWISKQEAPPSMVVARHGRHRGTAQVDGRTSDPVVITLSGPGTVSATISDCDGGCRLVATEAVGNAVVGDVDSVSPTIELVDVPAGKIDLVASSPKRVARQTVDVVSGGRVPVYLPLSSALAVSGRVRCSDGGTPSDFDVEAEGAGFTAYGVGTEGAFKVRSLIAGTYVVTIRAAHCGVGFVRTVTVAETETDLGLIALEPEP